MKQTLTTQIAGGDIMTAPLFAEQARKWLQDGIKRNREPLRPATIKAYRSQIETSLIPLVGNVPVDMLGSAVLKNVAVTLKRKGLKPYTIEQYLNRIKDVRRSVKDSEGRQCYPYEWDVVTVDAPIVNKKDQKRPIASAQMVQDAISKAGTRDGALWGILAGAGLRIAEALALDIGPDCGVQYHNVWLPNESKIIIRGQLLIDGSYGPPKTDAGEREVDICSELNDFLKSRITFGATGIAQIDKRMFRLHVRTYEGHLQRDGIVGGFHSLRRFRVTYARTEGVPDPLVHFWIGHEDETVTDGYTIVKGEIEKRKQWAAKIGLGFKLSETA